MNGKFSQRRTVRTQVAQARRTGGQGGGAYSFVSATLPIALIWAPVDVEITPEPTEEERQAILQALAEEADENPLTPWRAAALQGSDPLRSDAPAP